MKYTDLCKNIKQAGLGTDIAVGAGIGAVGGGLASLLPSAVDKRKRLRHALMLMGSGAIIGGSSAAALSKILPPKRSIVSGIRKAFPKVIKNKPIRREEPKRVRPLPGDSQAKFIADWVLGGKPLADQFPEVLGWDIIQKYGPNVPDNITDQIVDNAVRYLDNYKNKAIEVPQGGEPKK